jgi:hypothetical protein
MSIPPSSGKVYLFNPPPNWPPPPPGWTPPHGWTPDPSWPPPPYAWQLWVEAPSAVGTEQGAVAGVAAGSSRRLPRWVVIGVAVAVGLIIAAVMPGVLGHVLALIVWLAAAWSCLRPARAHTASAARTWARVGVAAFACLAVYAGSLAIVGGVASPNWYTNGYNYAIASYQASNSPADVYGSDGISGSEYLACRYVYLNDIPRSGEGTDTAGVAYNAPSVEAPESAAEAWVNGCTAGLQHVGQ